MSTMQAQTRKEHTIRDVADKDGLRRRFRRHLEPWIESAKGKESRKLEGKGWNGGQRFTRHLQFWDKEWHRSLGKVFLAILIFLAILLISRPARQCIPSKLRCCDVVKSKG